LIRRGLYISTGTIVETMDTASLRKRGYGVKQLFQDGNMVLDNLRSLERNRAVVGILQGGVLVRKSSWDTLTLLEDARVVYKQWVPIQHLLTSNEPIHILQGQTRWELTPTSCWEPRRVKDVKQKEVHKVLHKWIHGTSILMSDDKEMVLCTRGQVGWNSKALMRYDPLLPFQKAIHVNNVLVDLIKQHGDTHDIELYYRCMAHFQHSMALRLGIVIPEGVFSELTSSEEDMLSTYEETLARQMGHVEDV